MNVDYLIVGQGIAGTMLSYFLEKEKKSFKVIDPYQRYSASNIASGIINPITGRNFVKTWMADELIPFADVLYPQIEKELNISFFSKKTIYKVIKSIKDQNEWSAKVGSEDYKKYLSTSKISFLNTDQFINPFGAFEITGGSRIDGLKLLNRYREKLRVEGKLIESEFNHERLIIQNNHIEYEDLIAERIIFCEGHMAINNPLFNWVPFVLTKGEILIVELKDANFDFILNGNMVMMPINQDNLYYIGSTNDWTDLSENVTEKKLKKLKESISQLSSLPYTVVDHQAAIRPTMKDRRPVMGAHPEYNSVYIFNGMGTKGYSLSPYFANHFVQHLVHEKSLNKEVNITRNFTLYEA